MCRSPTGSYVPVGDTWQPDWPDLTLEARAAKLARQGVPTPTQDEVEVLDRNSGQPVPREARPSARPASAATR